MDGSTSDTEQLRQFFSEALGSRKAVLGASSAHWPRLEDLRLAPEAASDRQQAIGGSDANIILSGDPVRIHQLWLEKRGQTEPADLSTNLSVMLGCWTESFNRQWFEMLTGKQIISTGDSFDCPTYGWRRCTVDGLIEDERAIWEAKHTNAFANPDEVLERYMPQLQHNMAVTGYGQAALSVIFGNHKFEIFEVAADWLYQAELLKAEQHFWQCVVTGEEPAAVDPPPAPRPIGTREICLEGSNSWASAAFDWLKHREAAKIHASACASIKAQVEDDVSRAFGHGIQAEARRPLSCATATASWRILESWPKPQFRPDKVPAGVPERIAALFENSRIAARAGCFDPAIMGFHRVLK